MGTRNKLMRKKGVRKVSLKKRRQDGSKLTRAPVPVELRVKSNDIAERMNGHVASWDKEDTLVTNYKNNGFVLDPNAAVGGSAALGRQQHVVKANEEAHWVSVDLIKDGKLKESYEDDDEILAVENKTRSTGKREPKRLTTTQKMILKTLIDKHGEDVEAMAKDIKVNKMQHTVGQLREMIESLHYWGEDGTATKHDFRAPKKGPIRLSKTKKY